MLDMQRRMSEMQHEYKKILKDRQTQEKLVMFNEMMKNMDRGD